MSKKADTNNQNLPSDEAGWRDFLDEEYGALTQEQRDQQRDATQLQAAKTACIQQFNADGKWKSISHMLIHRDFGEAERQISMLRDKLNKIDRLKEPNKKSKERALLRWHACNLLCLYVNQTGNVIEAVPQELHQIIASGFPDGDALHAVLGTQRAPDKKELALEIVRNHPSISKKSLVKQSGLSWPTIGGMTDSLKAAGWHGPQANQATSLKSNSDSRLTDDKLEGVTKGKHGISLAKLSFED